MNNAIKIKDNIYWIGVNDRRTHIFENYWPLPKGVAYNSYVIADEKVVVIDTVERSRMDDYLNSLQAVLQGRKVDHQSYGTGPYGSNQKPALPLSRPDGSGQL